MERQPYSRQQYEDDFPVRSPVRRRALERALDIRKFEIGLYWTRATYFWVFIGATFAAFTWVLTGKFDVSEKVRQTDLLVILSNIGVVFSVAWLCVNKGSKHWQENWERHVDLLENELQGPLHKVVMYKGYPRSFRDWPGHVLFGPAEFSVSKVNLVVNWFVIFVWIFLLNYSLPRFDRHGTISISYVVICSGTAMACALFLAAKKWGKRPWASKRAIE